MSKKPIYAAGTAGIALLIVVAVSSSDQTTTTEKNLIGNGSFEDHGALNHDTWGTFEAIPFWSVESGDIEIQIDSTGGIPASNGRAKLELDAHNNSRVFQDLATETGQAYHLQLSYSPRVQNAATDTNDVKIWWEQDLIATLSGSLRRWQHHRFDVAATSAVSRLTLEAAGASDGLGGLVDDIRLFAKPYTTSNLIQNGSFEDHGPLNHGAWGTFSDIPGWVATNSEIEIQQHQTGGIQAAEGIAKAETDASYNAIVVQNIDTNAGGRYELGLQYSPRVETPGTDTNDVRVYWDNLLLARLSGDRRGWQNHVFDVRASVASTSIRLEGAGASDGLGGLIDDLRLYGVPYLSENLLVNGSFETSGHLNHSDWGTLGSIPGWTTDIGSVEIQKRDTGGIQAFEGNYKLELDAYSNSRISQEIETRTGALYELVLAYSPRVEDATTDTNKVEIWWDGIRLTVLDGDKRGWQRHRFQVRATTESTRLELAASGSSDSLGGLLDDLRLYLLADSNRPPVILSTPVTTAVSGTDYTYQVIAEDQNQDPLSFGLADAPTGMTIDRETGTIAWRPSGEGKFPVTVTVDDGAGGQDSQSYTVAVSLPNHRPSILSEPVTAIRLGHQYAYGVQATDLDGDVLTYSLLTAPGNMSIDSAGGSVTWTPAEAGNYPVSIHVTDGRGGSDTQAFTLQVSLPPNPDTIATPLASNGVTPPWERDRFLYTGENPVQTGVASEAIDPIRSAVIRGQVFDHGGLPLGGAAIRILDRPEFGQTHTRADGYFDMVVNGEGFFVVKYEKPGYLPAQRTVKLRWHEYAHADDVILLKPDPPVPIDLTASGTFQVVQGPIKADADGQRRATLLFPQGTQASYYKPDGSLEALPAQLNVRPTEYTVGVSANMAMPATLPFASAYTYAIELGIDEVAVKGGVKRGGKDVVFNQPVILYVDNFLEFYTGTLVPAGYYDPDKAAWIPADNGLVIKILEIADGKAVLAVEAEEMPATAAQLANLGITDAEREQLAILFDSGKSLWRTSLRHFSTYDLNQGIAPPDNAVQPPSPAPETPDPECPEEKPGCVIQVETQSLGEHIELVGVPFRLHYRNDRLPGGQKKRASVEIPITGASPPVGFRKAVLEIRIAGQRIRRSFDASSNQSFTFNWDGTDAYGRRIGGGRFAHIRVGYVYNAIYTSTSRFGYSGNGIPITAKTFQGSGEEATPRTELTLWREWETMLQAADTVSATSTVGGWTPGILHSYDPATQTLVRGDGGRRTAKNAGAVIHIADETNTGNVAGNRVSVDQRTLEVVRSGGDWGPDGSLYFVRDGKIYRRLPNGEELHFAFTGVNPGNINDSNLGDGGPATEALGSPYDVRVAVDGSVYVVNPNICRVRRIGPDGTITTVVGKGGRNGGYYAYTLSDPANYEDGAPAKDTALIGIGGIALSVDGSLFVSEVGGHAWSRGTARIIRIGRDGRITNVAGGGEPADGVGDGLPAKEAKLLEPGSLAIGPGGDLYVMDGSRIFWMNNRLRRIGVDGMIRTIAGDGNPVDDYGNGGPAANSVLWFAGNIRIAGDSSVYFFDGNHGHIRRIGPALPGSTLGGILIPSRDGSELYSFDETGRHLATLQGLTGQTLLTFQYGGDGFLDKVIDGDSNTTIFERNTVGEMQAIIAPFGQRTELGLDPEGFLSSVTNPMGEVHSMRYSADGLLTGYSDPKGNTHDYVYDALGRLTNVQAPENGGWKLTRETLGSGYSVSLTSAEERVSSHQVESLSSGDFRRIIAAADGSTRLTERRHDGRLTSTVADGTRTETRLGPDPRFGMISPIAIETSVSVPSGLTVVQTSSRSLSLTDPSDIFSFPSIIDTTTNNGRTSTVRYDALNKTWIYTSPENRILELEIDAFGRPVRARVPGLAEATYDYDSLGRLAAVARTSGSDTRTVNLAYATENGFLAVLRDAENKAVQYEYDSAGRVSRQSLPDTREIKFGYDANGNLISLKPPGRPDHRFHYDPADQEDIYTPPVVSGVPLPTTRYAYDRDRMLTTIDRPDKRSIMLDYDSATGKLTRVSLPRGTYSYEYDPIRSQLTGITAPDGNSLSFAYDGFLQTASVWSGEINGSVNEIYGNDFNVQSRGVNGSHTIEFGYDNDLLLTRAGNLFLSRDMRHGLITGSVLGDLATSRVYNDFGETSGFNVTYSASPLFEIAYLGRDKLGRITEKQEILDGVTTTFGYAYDLAGRLTTVTENGVAIRSYSYDENGNRTLVNGIPVATYDEQDRLLAYKSNEYTYSENGELLTKSQTSSGETTSYNYDVLGNLISVQVPDGSNIEYLIDGLNRRIGKKVNGTLIRGFLYKDQLNPIAELDGHNNVVARFVYADKANVPAYMEKDGNTYRIVSDHLGSPRLIIDTATGDIIQRMDYDEWGNVIQDTNPGFQPFGFAGGIYDRHTKLVRFGARDYDPEIGRWTAKDPIGFSGDSLNLYDYVLSEPINFTDPAGLIPPGWVRRNLHHKPLRKRSEGFLGGGFGASAHIGPVGLGAGAGVIGGSKGNICLYFDLSGTFGFGLFWGAGFTASTGNNPGNLSSGITRSGGFFGAGGTGIASNVALQMGENDQPVLGKGFGGMGAGAAGGTITTVTMMWCPCF